MLAWFRSVRLGIAGVIGGAAAHAGMETVRFDLTTAPLGIFGLEFSADFLTPVESVQAHRITRTRLHLEFNTSNPLGSIADAATIALQIQPPTVNLPIETFSGATFGWSGTGEFVGDLETDIFNKEFLDFSGQDPPAEFALWFTRIVNLDDAMPALGGQFSNSYVEFDLAPVPEPASALLLAVAGVALRRR